MLSHLDANAPLLRNFAVMWRAVHPAVCLSGRSAKGLLASSEARRAAVEVGKDGKCWGLEVMLLGLSIPNPCQAGGGSPGGQHPASKGSSTTLCIPCGLDVEAGSWWGEVRIRLLRLSLLWFHFTVPAQLLAGLSGAPGLWDQPRAAAVGFLQGKTCWVGVKSRRGHVFTAGLQEPNSLQHTGNCFCKGRFAALPGGAGSGMPGHPLVLPVPLPSCKGLPFSLPSLHPSLPGQL